MIITRHVYQYESIQLSDNNTYPFRLSKYLRQATKRAHRQIKQAVDGGRVEVLVDGQMMSLGLGSLVFPDDVVYFDGQPLTLRQPEHYWLLHKPMGVLTTVRDPHQRSCLAPWMNILPAGVFPVGRLDRATTGALLLTDDGDLAYMMLQPEHHVDKHYVLTIDGVLAHDDARLNELRAGVVLSDGLASAKQLWVVEHSGSQTLIRMVIDEGRNRQVRRMCKRVRLPLAHLHRAQFGEVHLGDISPGQMRALSDSEVCALWLGVGGQEVVWQQTLAAFVDRYQKGTLCPISQPRFGSWYAAYLADQNI